MVIPPDEKRNLIGAAILLVVCIGLIVASYRIGNCMSGLYIDAKYHLNKPAK